MHEDWQESEGTRGHKYWGMGSEARKMVADHMKAKGGALRDRKTCLNLRLDNGRCVCEYVNVVNAQLCCMYVYVCVCNNWTDGAPYPATEIVFIHEAKSQKTSGHLDDIMGTH
jgi:hypothetical protein